MPGSLVLFPETSLAVWSRQTARLSAGGGSPAHNVDRKSWQFGLAVCLDQTAREVSGKRTKLPDQTARGKLPGAAKLCGAWPTGASAYRGGALTTKTFTRARARQKLPVSGGGGWWRVVGGGGWRRCFVAVLCGTSRQVRKRTARTLGHSAQQTKNAPFRRQIQSSLAPERCILEPKGTKNHPEKN